MKLVYITSTSFIDGDFPLVKHLKEKGVDVYLFILVRSNWLKSTLFNIKDQYPESGIFDSSIYEKEISCFRSYLGVDNIFIINTFSNSRLKEKANLSRKLLDMIRNIAPDIIQFIAFPEVFELPILIKYHKRVIVTVHDPVPHINNIRAKKIRLLRRATNWLIRRFILLNPLMTDEFCKYYAVTKKKIRYSKLGNFEILGLFGKEGASKEKKILFVGRVSKYKGIEYLLKAYSGIMDSYPDTKLIIAGSGDYYFDISAYRNHPQIEIINRYIDMDEMGTLFKNCEFVVCPYISATQSGVVVSSFAVNKPVIVTNVGGLPAMVENGKTGLIVPPKDPQALADAMRYLLSQKNRLESMSKQIQKDSLEGDNSWGNIADNYIKIYEEIIK